MTARLDSRALEQFAAVARTLSFRHAAESLHMSQPPLSRAIRELEDRLGVRLFERDTHGVALTGAGAELLPRAERILALIAQAEDAVAAHADAARLRIGVTTAVELSSLDPLLARLAKARPRAALETSADSSPRLVRALRAGRPQDLAIERRLAHVAECHAHGKPSGVDGAVVALGRPHLWNPTFVRQAEAWYGVRGQSWPQQYWPGRDQAFREIARAADKQAELQIKAKPKRHGR